MNTQLVVDSSYESSKLTLSSSTNEYSYESTIKHEIVSPDKFSNEIASPDEIAAPQYSPLDCFALDKNLSLIKSIDNHLIKDFVIKTSNLASNDDKMGEKFDLKSIDLPANLKSNEFGNHNSIESFKDLNLKEKLLQGIYSIYIKQPNDLQKAILPDLINNKLNDILVRSKPYSGKKTSYLIAAINSIDTNLNKCQIVIIPPTSELIFYILESAKDLAKYTSNIRINYLTRDHQPPNKINDHLIISTAGSLLFCLDHTSTIDLSDVKYLILDELDILLSSDNNQAKIERLIKHFLKSSNCKLFTFSTGCNSFTIEFIQRIKRNGLLFLNLLNMNCFKDCFLHYYAYENDKAKKYNVLVKTIKKILSDKIVIYASRAAEAYFLNADLKQDGFKTILLTSKSVVEKRLEGIKQFDSSNGQIILIIMYPLSHGISIDDVCFVINYNLPLCSRTLYIEYIHRICKCTASNERKASVINFIDDQSVHHFEKLENYFKITMTRLNLLDN